MAHACLRSLVKEEQSTTDLMPPPHVNYIEIAYKLMSSPADPWASPDGTSSNKDSVVSMLEFYNALRRRKIREIDNQFLANGHILTTNLSIFEKSYISTDLMSYMRRAERPCNAPVVDVPTQLHILGFEAAYEGHRKWLSSMVQEFGSDAQ